jgi:hypothetical protein
MLSPAVSAYEYGNYYPQEKEKFDLSLDPVKKYLNYAEQGSYENESWIGEYYPEWHYYDSFGNHLIDGYYIYGFNMNRRSAGVSESAIVMNELFRKWFNGLLVMGDILDDRGIMVMIGNRINSFFTPLTFNQSLFAGTRVDLYAKSTSLSAVSQRISNTGGSLGGILDADWVNGLHLTSYIRENINIGGTYVNLHHEESGEFSNPFSGVDSDTSTLATPTGLDVYGINFKLDYPDLKLSGEFTRSLKTLDGDFLLSPGDAFFINMTKGLSPSSKLGAELYQMAPTFKTEFSCPAHPQGDAATGTNTEKYLYQLVEDNDDRDDYPENGKSRVSSVFTRDSDGPIPQEYDRNKDSIWDFKQDFLSYETDHPKSKFYFDRNNNLVPDNIEDDLCPDYPYLPSFYLEGEEYYRYNDFTKSNETNISTSNADTHRGLLGIHLSFTSEIEENLNGTIGVLYDSDVENSYRKIYSNGIEVGKELKPGTATNLYGLIKYRKEFGRKGVLTVTDMIMKVDDTIPNHTAGFGIDLLGNPTYYVVQDDLPLRNSMLNRTIVEYELSRNRGLSFLSRLNYEAGQHTEELRYNYPERQTSSTILLNKVQYIYPAPWEFLKGLFIIPQYKNVYEDSNFNGSTQITSPLDRFYSKHSMAHNINLVNEYKLTPKTRITAAFQIKRFNDLSDVTEDYFQKNLTLQLVLQDHYRGFSMFLTCGLSNYVYFYDHSGITHDSENNPHRVTDNININEVFVKVHCGF